MVYNKYVQGFLYINSTSITLFFKAFRKKYEKNIFSYSKH